MSFVLLLSLTGIAGLWFLLRSSLTIGRREPNLPPGPPTLPFLGNLHMIPRAFIHFKFTEWAKTYGPIYSLKIGSGTYIVISGMNAAKELLDRRSGSTADRPPNYIAETIAEGKNMVLARYTETWRSLRKTAHAILTPQGVNRHLPIQNAEAIQVMHDFLNTPQDWYTHIRRYSNSVIMSIVYGKRSPRYETSHSTAFFHVQHLWEKALEPGAHPPIDILPFLKYIPESWGAAGKWKTLCREVRSRQRALYFGLLDECRERLRNGNRNGCFMEEVVNRKEEFGLTDELAGYLGGVLIEGGSDTTSSLLQTIVLVLVVFPHAQRKAQAEIDRVVGDGRIPSLDDVPSLPYIQALIKEAHRFRPLAPTGVPHCTLTDEEYLGYHIPKGSTVFPNIWGIFHDPDIFEDPEAFNPDRFLANEFGVKPGVDTQDFRVTVPFGFGRRICPGIHLANNSLLLNVMNMVWGFEFRPTVDPTSGKENVPDLWNYEGGLLTGPRPFPCQIECRSQARKEIIEREFTEALEAFLPFEVGLDSEHDY